GVDAVSHRHAGHGHAKSTTLHNEFRFELLRVPAPGASGFQQGCRDSVHVSTKIQVDTSILYSSP
ncbi:MAG: hypothetical protein RIS90_666, partial [Pseudomonadota bacterium]